VRFAGRVNDRLDPHRAAVLEVLLDPRVLVEDVEHDAAGVRSDRGPVDRGAEHPRGVPVDVAGEDDLDVGGAADVQVVADQCLEEAADPAGRVEDDGAGDLDLPHG